MKKYGVIVTCSESRYIEVEAKNEEDAEEQAYIHIDSAEPYSDDDYSFEVEELND